ncbi:hypothetical protein [Tahibacter amnicola]|uniref:Uncharacterized protein n=1 Tax=Tahibacter amnicola TaxID=2976241 RepID=A0ABY6BIQ5_9GAMM|nr:hypothetical protein [Tahibacter amnicola]UXI68501.1 hypothetical protein N4264_02275 [Tahibacter amnicola]
MRSIFILIAFIVPHLAHAGSVASGIKDLDEGTRASVVKEMSKMRLYEDDKLKKQGQRRSNSQSGECGDMNVGNTETRRGPTPRKVTTVVTGNIVQLCNK